jgi:hypothetical protein
MAESCPIAYEVINSKGARLNALLVSFLLLLILFTPLKWLVFVLVFDFFIRAFTKKKWSLFAHTSKQLLALLKQKPKMTNAGPKVFAAKIGFVFSLALSICYVFGFMRAMNIVLIIFLVCAALEGILGFCVACKIYPLFQRAKCRQKK